MEETFAPGDLVTVATGGPLLDAIVVERPSPQKAIVAVVDAAKGPVMRSVSVDVLAEREAEGPHDKALHSLIRRSQHAFGGGPRGGGGGVQGSRGFGRAAMHRREGK
jgi:hypothetical protein